MSRTITGKLRHFVNNEPLANTPIIFRLKTDVATEPGEAFPTGEYTVTTDVNGDIPAGFALAVPPTGAWHYSCKISGNRAFDFYLEDGAAMTIDDIVALAGLAGTEPSPSFTPDPHAASHATGGSDPLTPADIGAEVAGTTATHAALTGTAAHGLGTMSTQDATSFVLKTGDTMTGALALPANGLSVGAGNIHTQNNAVVFGLVATPRARVTVFGDLIIRRPDGMGTIRCDNFNEGAGGAIQLVAGTTSAEQYIRFGTTPSGTQGDASVLTELVRITSAGRLGVGTSDPLARIHAVEASANGTVQILQLAAAHTANAQEIRASTGTVLSATRPDGSWQLPQIADAAAANNSLYYSTTQSKLVYKDPAGVVNVLY